MPTDLEKALSALTVHEIRLRRANIQLVDELEPAELKNQSMEVQGLRRVGKIKEISLKEGEEEWWQYNFFYTAGIRLVDKEKAGEPAVEIQATFNALYRSREKLESGPLKSFSEEHVGYHVWPYWREYVQSTSMRMGIAPIRIPLYRVSGKGD